jgi:hypothetical protein
MVLAVVVADIVCPLIFASILSRVASLPLHTVTSEWHRFGPLLLAYGVAGLIAMGMWRVAGWFEWGACVRSFAKGLNNGYEHLLRAQLPLAHGPPGGRGHLVARATSRGPSSRWSTWRRGDCCRWRWSSCRRSPCSRSCRLAGRPGPARHGGRVRLRLDRRLPLVRAASQEFENHHSKATGVVADTVTNLMAVRTAAAEPQERYRVEDLMQQSVDADLRARSIFMRTQLQLETSIVVGTLLASIAGTTMAVHHWASTAALYLILYYSAQVALSLQQSFEHLRSFARSLGRAAKFTAIAGEEIEITNAPERPGSPGVDRRRGVQPCLLRLPVRVRGCSTT